MTFIGTVEAPTQGGTLAVLSDGQRVFHGHEGEVIDGRFRILQIGPASVELAYADGGGQQTIPLTSP